MRKCVPKMRELERQAGVVGKIVFMAVKQDVLSKDLQDSDLITPELLNAVTKCIAALEKVVRLLQNMDRWHSYNSVTYFQRHQKLLSNLKSLTISLKNGCCGTIPVEKVRLFYAFLSRDDDNPRRVN